MDIIGDMLTRIKNGYRREHKSVLMPHSKMKMEIAKVMSKNGYLGRVKEKTEEGKKMIQVELRYDNGQPALMEAKRVSKPGRRMYSNCKNIQKTGGRRGMIILSTSQGIMPHWEASKKKAGGEVLCVMY